MDLHKLLGVLIDSKLSFHPHVLKACAKAQGALLKVSCIFLGRKGLPVNIALQVYVALCRSLAEYAIPAWWFRGVKYLNHFQDMQYMCLRSICGAFKKSSARALEAITGVMPIHLIIKDLCMREIIKSLSYFHPLYEDLVFAEHDDPSRLSPLGFLACICRKFKAELESNNYQIMERSVLAPSDIACQRSFATINIFEERRGGACCSS